MAARGPKIPGARFSEKKPPDFLKFIGPATPLWALYPSETMHMGFTEPLLARAVFARSVKLLRWHPGSIKIPLARFSEKTSYFFLKFIGPVTHLWVLYPSEIMHKGFTELLLARAVFARSIKVLERQPGAPKTREHDFPKKNLLMFF